MSDKVQGIIAAGIRQYCSDVATEYAYHEPTRDLSLIHRFHDDAETLARYIEDDGFRNNGIVGYIDAEAHIKERVYTDADFDCWVE